jgi:multiple sugar transport system ATP-binding protein
MAELVLEHVSKTYATGIRAVRDLDLAVADGEFVVLVGPSGCGKTTILRLIAGLEGLTTGSIRIGGRVVNKLPPSQRDVAMVFQRPTIYPHVSVRRNLSMALDLRSVGILGRLAVAWLRPDRYREWLQQRQRFDERVAHTARLVGLDGVLDRRPSQLSGGEQQRVALGRAIVREPSVFLLDEPLSHLDSNLRAELRHELHLLQRRLRATMVYVTHDQAEAMALADRVVVIDQGVVRQVDRPMAVYERPHNRFVAGFIGYPAMNFADGRLVNSDGRACFEKGSWSLPLPAGAAPLEAIAKGEPLTLGIRPEHIRLAGPGVSDLRLVMEVILVEPLGHEWLVTLERDGWRATARLADREAIGNKQTVEVVFLMEHAHWFDRSTGIALSRPAG